MSHHTLKAIIIFVIFSFIYSQNVNAQIRCETLFKNTHEATLDLPSPLESRYTSLSGALRFYRDGTIYQYQERSREWVDIGRGNFDEQVVESQLHAPDIRRLRDFQISFHDEVGNRFYTNSKNYYPSLIRRVQIGDHTIEIVAPQGQGLEQNIEGVYQTLLELPLNRIHAIRTIRLNTRTSVVDQHYRDKYPGFIEAGATATKDEIDIFGPALNHFLSLNVGGIGLLRHEFGHVLAQMLFGTHQPSKRYIEAAQKDSYSVSEYGNNSWIEDFAEGIKAYLDSGAGLISSQKRNDLIYRFTIFDDIFADRMP